ncbi:MAG TPA: CHAD domain-containing protein [Candidatus Limnocylindrales bacterium]|nr:CHAD domain-containing protein [Candidatus Limnocylindrales bacterium]
MTLAGEGEPATEPTPAEEAALPLPPELGPAPGPILATDPLDVAGRKAMWTHVDRLLRHEAAMRDPERADELRRFRVATRRLRAAIRLFRPAFKDSEVDPIADALGTVADAVGAVRDIDVHVAALLAWATERGPDSVLRIQPLVDAWQAERRAGMAVLEGRLASRRHARLLTRLVDFVRLPDRGGDDQGSGPVVRDRAGSQVWRAFEQVREFTPIVRWADPPTLHRLRIQAKRLRYSLEFLGDVLGPDRPWLVERLVALQDHLGALNDAVVTSAAVRAFLAHAQARLSPAERAEVVAYLEAREREARSLRRAASRPWRAVAGITFARRLARTAIVR